MRDPRWQRIYDRMTMKARSRLDDLPLITKTVDAADTRAEGFRELRDELQPLRRLVISSLLRKSYGGASKADLAQALAAITYVASPIDAIPDAWPGGLKDDLVVVRMVKDRLEPSLAEYHQWAESFGQPAELEQAIGRTFELAIPDEMTVELVGRERSLSGAGGRDSFAAVQQAVEGSGEVVQALRQGQVLRVVGPAHLLKGIQSHALELVPTASGSIGTVRDVSSKEFVGQLRVGEPGTAQAAAAGVAAGFAVASAVTMQYYLHNIDSKLERIQRDLKALNDRNLDGELAEIQTALTRAEEAERALQRAGRFGSRELLGLETADDRVDGVFNRVANELARFAEKVDATIEPFDEVEKQPFAELLEDAVEQRLPQLQLLLAAACVRDRVNALRVIAASSEGEEHARVAQETLEGEHAEMAGKLTAACAALRKLQAPKDRVDERWPHLGGPERELLRLLEATRALAEAGGQDGQPHQPTIETGSTAHVALPIPEPVLTEIWMDGDQLQQQEFLIRQPTVAGERQPGV